MSQPQSIGTIVFDFLRENGLETTLLEREVEKSWGKVMGKMIEQMTRSVSVKNGVLFVRLSNAALRAQLFENRYELVRKMNTAVGVDVIQDVRLLG